MKSKEMERQVKENAKATINLIKLAVKGRNEKLKQVLNLFKDDDIFTGRIIKMEIKNRMKLKWK